MKGLDLSVDLESPLVVVGIVLFWAVVLVAWAIAHSQNPRG
jgi:hypothetical protein